MHFPFSYCMFCAPARHRKIPKCGGAKPVSINYLSATAALLIHLYQVHACIRLKEYILVWFQTKSIFLLCKSNLGSIIGLVFTSANNVTFLFQYGDTARYKIYFAVKSNSVLDIYVDGIAIRETVKGTLYFQFAKFLGPTKHSACIKFWSTLFAAGLRRFQNFQPKARSDQIPNM